MKLGVDFGTTRIVVAAVDRGNYPVLTFEDTEGTAQEWFPPLIASRVGERLYGWEAWAVQTDPSYTVVRSLKRSLEDAGPQSMVHLGDHSVPLLQVLEEMVHAMKRSINLPRGPHDHELEVMLGVPANANSNQRYLTVEPFQRAGCRVLGLLNEPSAASIEYGHRLRGAEPTERVLVYDLGGGTFDVSVVEIEGRMHSVVASEGVPTLGGDDFDAELADLATSAADIKEELSPGEWFRLHEECRRKKEALHPNTRRIVVDLSEVRPDWEAVTVPVDAFYERCRPLVQQTIDATEHLLRHYERLEAVYITGGGSELPLVPRMLKEVFGRKVQRSAHTRSATAIGLAIQADERAGYVLREKFTRHFGVWREADGGGAVTFDVLFPKGTSLPGAGQGPLTISRFYSPVHNVGHFRYLECSQRDEQGRPTGDIAVWDEILFPFSPALQEQHELNGAEVRHDPIVFGEQIEEQYSCDPSGSVRVMIRNHSANYERVYRLGRWASKETAIVPGKQVRQKQARNPR